MVPSNLEHHVSSSQPRLGSRLFVYTPVCGALTFPLPTSTSRKNLLTNCFAIASRFAASYATSRLVPLRRVFSNTVFSTDSIQSPLTSWPNSFDGLPHSGGRSTCTSVLLRGPFPQRYLQTGPPTLCVGLFCLFYECLSQFIGTANSTINNSVIIFIRL